MGFLLPAQEISSLLFHDVLNSVRPTLWAYTVPVYVSEKESVIVNVIQVHSCEWLRMWKVTRRNTRHFF